MHLYALPISVVLMYTDIRSNWFSRVSAYNLLCLSALHNILIFNIGGFDELRLKNKCLVGQSYWKVQWGSSLVNLNSQIRMRSECE